MLSQYKGLPLADSMNESVVSISSSGNTNPLVLLDPGLFIWTIITFIVLLMVLGKFAWRPLLTALDDRESKIRNSLDNADKARKELGDDFDIKDFHSAVLMNGSLPLTVLESVIEDYIADSKI